MPAIADDVAAEILDLKKQIGTTMRRRNQQPKNYLSDIVGK